MHAPVGSGPGSSDHAGRFDMRVLEVSGNLEGCIYVAEILGTSMNYIRRVHARFLRTSFLFLVFLASPLAHVHPAQLACP